jgi:hypothetical protein
MRIPNIPFKILVLAPFSGRNADVWREGPVRVDNMSLDEAIDGMGLSLSLNLPKTLCPPGELTLNFSKIKDFHPDGLLKSNPFLRNLLEARKFIEEAGSQGLSREEVCNRLAEWPNLPSIDMKTDVKRFKASPSSAIDEIIKMVALPGEEEVSSSKAQTLLAQIDSIFRQIMCEIFSQNRVRELESVWSGLRFLLRSGRGNGEVKLEIVPVLRENLRETLHNLLPEIALDPPDLLMFDLPFDNTPLSLELLEEIAQFAETLLAPSICWIDHNFLHLDTWEDLKRLSYLPHYLEKPAFAKWRRLKEIGAGRWIAIICNRFLLRYPYGSENRPRLVDFEEDQELWASPVWALGCLVSQSVVKSGWPTRFTDWQRVRIDGLALYPVAASKLLPTETSFSEDRIEQLIRVGIVPLVSSYNKDVAFTPFETTVAGTPLSYQLLVTRMSRLLFWCKDNFEKDMEPTDLEKDLKMAFSLFWENTGHPAPENLEISVQRPDPDKPAMVQLEFEPSPQILSPAETVELRFYW